jgi:hypothetical protein
MFCRHTEDDDLVSSAMQTLARTPLEQGALPDPSFIWWKAQLLRRREAEREATTPIDIGDRFHVGAAILGAAALAAGAWDAIPALTFSPATGLTVALGVIVLVSVLAFATWDGLRH